MNANGLDNEGRKRADGVDADTDNWIEQSYSKLHRLAAFQMLGEANSHTLSATSLVNEVYLRLKRSPTDWINERQFLAAAAIEMRRVLVDAARSKKSLKRGGNLGREMLNDQQSVEALADHIIELGEAVDALQKVEPIKAELVRLRYFLGLTEQEAAEALGVSRATASRHWNFARAWLLNFLKE